MSTPRWPNTLHWQRTESALRSIHGISWRRRGEDLFACGPGALRAIIDRKLDDAQMTALENILGRALREHAAAMRDKAAAADRAAESFDDDSAYRRADFMETPRDRLFRQWSDWGIASNTEAA